MASWGFGGASGCLGGRSGRRDAARGATRASHTGQDGRAPHQERAESKGGFVVRALVSLQQLKYGSMYVRVLVRRAKQMGEAE